MSNILWLDYESRSECNLTTKGAYNYAAHPSTKVICAAYAFDDEPVQLWWADEPFPKRVADYFFSGGQIRCHNEEFDRLITWYVVCPDYNVSEPILERWYCTAVQAAANGLPRSLEDVGRAVDSQLKKDHRGAYLIRQLCIPPFSEDPTLLQEFGEYCVRDVETMRCVSKSLRELSAEEHQDYIVNARINMRGVLVDVPLCRSAMTYSAQELEEAQAVFREITGLDSIRSPKMREWVWDRVGPEAQKLMTLYKDGEKKRSIDKNVRKNLLTLSEEAPLEVSEDVAEVIRCADDIWASSTAKFSRLANLADDEDSRLRGAFVFNGGSATGRAASYGAQVHNLPRKCAGFPDEVQASMVLGHALTPAYGSRVSDVLKSMLRPSLLAPAGKALVVSDWSAIEGRVNPWLADTTQGEAKLDVYRAGRDPYIVNASALFGVAYEAVTSEQRFVGKVQELALGFLGGAGAFAKFAPGHTDTFVAKAVQAWRRVNPWAVNHGQLLENAYLRAMRNKGHEFGAGRITYLFDGEHLWYALPSGRVLRYPYAKLDEDGVTYLKASWKPAADAKEWPRARLWKGLALENTTQAVANDLLRNTLRQCDAAGISAIMHIHDEVVLECDIADTPCAVEELKRIMVTPPSWAAGIPLAVEIKTMSRYSK